MNDIETRPKAEGFYCDCVRFGESLPCRRGKKQDREEKMHIDSFERGEEGRREDHNLEAVGWICNFWLRR